MPSRTQRAATGRRGRLPAALAVVLACLALTGCFSRSSDQPRARPPLKGTALAAEVARLEAELTRVPHVTRSQLQLTDNITNGQTFAGVVYTDTNDRTTLDGVLDGVARILWSTTAFVPDDISTSVVGADGASYADYRSIGATSQYGIGPDLLEKRYGPAAFLVTTPGG